MESKQVILSTLRKFEVSDDGKSLGIYLFTLVALFVLVSLSTVSYQFNPWFSAFFWIPNGIILCRFFVLQHDCGHFSFFTKKKYNQTAGSILGFFTMIQSPLWNHIHNVHHGTLGNLNKRKTNPELWTLTVNEYLEAGFLKKVAYRIMRSVIMRLLITPALWMVGPRIPLPHLGKKILISTLLHNIIYGLLFFIIIRDHGFRSLLFIYLIPLYLFNFMASVMFYLQHQYEDTLWVEEKDWDYFTASLTGSSYVKVGPFMRWLTGNVGCHHIHHLNTRIPSYQLDKATNEANKVLEVKPIFLGELFHHLNCALWDEEAKKLISFKALGLRKGKS